MVSCVNDSLFIDNDNNLIVDKVTNDFSGDFINDALVDATLKDSSGDNVGGGTAWPLRLTYVTGSNGQYAGVLQNTLNLNENEVYTLIIDISGASLEAHWEKQLRAIVRS